MKIFLYKVVLFCLFPVLFFGLNGIANFYIYSNAKVDMKKSRVLIIGDSHTQKAIDPKLFFSAKNISQTAEPYVITHWKLTKALKSFIPDTVIIGFAPHNISAFNDLKFSDKTWSSRMFERVYPIENFDSVDDIIEIDYYLFYKVLWKQTCFYPKKSHHHYIGKYTNKKFTNLSDWQSVINRHYYYNNTDPKISEVSISHLDSIINICHSNKITPVLVSNPVHHKYFENIPPSIFKEYVKLKERLTASGIIVIDESNTFYPDSLYFNADHLNIDGSERFTKELIYKLNSFSSS